MHCWSDFNGIYIGIWMGCLHGGCTGEKGVSTAMARLQHVVRRSLLWIGNIHTGRPYRGDNEGSVETCQESCGVKEQLVVPEPANQNAFAGGWKELPDDG
jgi:hypothetical protein